MALFDTDRATPARAQGRSDDFDMRARSPLVACYEHVEKTMVCLRIRTIARASLSWKPVLQNPVCLMFVWALDFEFSTYAKVFEGLRHARATTHACALRLVICAGILKTCDL
eukprot:8551542-Pyramimonas_sp.AAC.1